MTITEKIKVFSTVESLISEIETDRFSNNILTNRYAVRFIMLDNFNIFQNLSLELTKLGINTLGLETLLLPDNQDRWITQDELKFAIGGIDKPTIVSPFSEIVRFYEEDRFLSFFNEMALLENPRNVLNRRIYIPLIGLESRFSKFLASFGRIEESAPVWSVKTGETQPVTIYLTPNNSNSQDFSFPQKYRGLETLHEWLLFWKTKAPTEKIICSSLPINVYYKNSQPDNIFDIQRIETAHEFITKYLNIQIDIDYKDCDECFWLQLLPFFNNDIPFSFKSFVEKYFNVYRLSVKDVLNKWTSANNDNFSRWLLKHYCLKYLPENSYLNSILADCLDYSHLRLYREIAISIFVDTNDVDMIRDRKLLLNALDERYKLPEADLTNLKELTLEMTKRDIDKAIVLCSGRFDFEKELFINWFKVEKLSLNQMKSTYPDFVAYMEDITIEGWINNYIQAYKQAKVKDKYTDDIRNFIQEKNANENSFFNWYNSNDFEKSIELLSSDNPDKIYWIDGLGIEYMSLIKYLIDNSQFKVLRFLVAKTGIPSNTEFNKFEGATKIEILDKYIHNNLYEYPKTIYKEIDIVKSIFKDILNQPLDTTVAIVSDHGLTALSRLVNSKKYSAKASHEGRYIKLNNEEVVEDQDYIRFQKGSDFYKIALSHGSLNTKPVREVHGGCTPEEVLVPYILISNKEVTDINKIKVATIEKRMNKEQPKTKGFVEEDLF